MELDDLQEIIEQDGWTSEYKNGENQYGTKKSPEADTYIALSKNYAAVIGSRYTMYAIIADANKLFPFFLPITIKISRKIRVFSSSCMPKMIGNKQLCKAYRI